MRRGALVPDVTVWKMVRERSACLHCGDGFILDGFPRTLAQAESLKGLLEEEHIPLTAVVNYELPELEIVARLSGRRTCEQCRAVCHVVERPPRVDGVCDRCGGNLFQREDDRPESITVRLAAYRQSTAPLIAFYQDQGLLLHGARQRHSGGDLPPDARCPASRRRRGNRLATRCACRPIGLVTAAASRRRRRPASWACPSQ